MIQLEEIVPGVHRWTARHPDWKEDQGGAEGWGEEVACLAYEGDGAVVLVDPLVNGDWEAIDALVESHGDRVAIVTLCAWHGRDAGEALARYDNLDHATTHAHAKTADHVSFEVTHVIEGDEPAELPGGIKAFVTDAPQGEITLYLERARSVVAGDVLLGAEGERSEALRVCPEAWLEGNTVAAVKTALKPLLDAEISAIAPLHGAPVTDGAHEALERAVS